MSQTTDNNIAVVPDIMHYESKIWSVADLLLSAGIKQSDFPNYMMPFFGLMMLEGRMRNYIHRVEEEFELTPKNDPEDFKEAYLNKNCGWNEYIVMQGKTLAKICANDKSFEQDFGHYLDGFDSDLKRLLGINRGKDEEKFLAMDEMVANLRAKGILLQVATIWSEIDLAPYSNSDITTLEEHIKRKWADISASTAGEQYTPDDIISLISEIVGTKISRPKNQYVHIYDPTCGGANLLFGTADRLHRENGYNLVATYGSELNDKLYALAAIESRFRDDSNIQYGNTLTRIPFRDKKFNVIVANPPYGTKWSGYEKEIRHDESGQFAGGKPSISDGQLLFMQHILWQLADDGIAVEVHNGASLFSGDAGGGESNIRKYIFDHDWVEAIIQMPQQEFFNTGIYTYLWVMNKNKAADRRNRVALIDGSNGWQLLKKSKGDKRREMSPDNRRAIIDALTAFEPSDICKIFDRSHFYYNKQQLTLTEISDDGRSVKDTVCPEGKAFVVKNVSSIAFQGHTYNDLLQQPFSSLQGLAKAITADKGENLLTVTTDKGDSYELRPENNTIVYIQANGTEEDLGCGDIILKVTAKKGTDEVKNVKVQIEPRLTRDYEIVPFHFDEEENREEIDRFMQKYIFKPYVLDDDTIGVEINFNKEFYVPEPVEPVEDILKEIKELDEELGEIEL